MFGFSKAEKEVTKLKKELTEERLRYTKLWLQTMQLSEASKKLLKLYESQESQFTQTEIRLMIRLCHPDKHGNNRDANEITSKLLRLRK